MSSNFSTIAGSKRSLHAQVAREIARGILSGELPQGSIIPGEIVLCEQFGISRTALREAIKLLTSKGLLESKPKIGTKVVDKSNWNFLDFQLLEWIHGLANSQCYYQQFLGLRKAIEPEACALAAKFANQEQRTELSKIFGIMCEAAQDDNIHEWAKADLHFHRLIFFSTGNDFYLPFGNVLATIFNSFMTYRIQQNNIYLEEQRSIYEAIIEGDSEKAKQAMFNLLEKED